MTNAARLQPYARNPFYWQYKGKPVLLLGGSVTDHLFLIDDLEAHLDEMVAVGANYVRNTMSQREAKYLKPHRLLPDGKFDLEQWNEEYWRRFRNFLRWTHEREIIVQIEVWDRFDYSQGNWDHSPWNPANNVNYTAAETGLAAAYPDHPGQDKQCFFHTAPGMDDNALLRRYQEAFVDQMLACSLRYGHVLYCMDNETNTAPAWGAYWANHIKAKAAVAGTMVEVTEMWDEWSIEAPCHNQTLDDASIYSFVEVSQLNHQQNRAHWDNVRTAVERVKKSGVPRPLNSVKIYGASGGTYGRNRDGQERFWRDILGGLAAARFHREPSGLGLNDVAKAHLRSLRLFTGSLHFFRCEPHQELLGWFWRDRNEAYCIARPGEEYGVFFTDGGMVELDVSAVGESPLTVRWLDIMASAWREPVTVTPENGRVRLQTPRDGYWAVVVKRARA